jgi:hypothetical protein
MRSWRSDPHGHASRSRKRRPSWRRGGGGAAPASAACGPQSPTARARQGRTPCACPSLAPPQATLATSPRTGTRREARVGRAGGAGGGPRPRPQAAAPRPRPVRLVGVRCRPRSNRSRRWMTRARCPRASPSCPGGSSLGGSLPAVGRPRWPRDRWGWRRARPAAPRSSVWRPPGGSSLPSVTSAWLRS